MEMGKKGEGKILFQFQGDGLAGAQYPWARGIRQYGPLQGWLPRHVIRAAAQGPTLRRASYLV